MAAICAPETQPYPMIPTLYFLAVMLTSACTNTKTLATALVKAKRTSKGR